MRRPSTGAAAFQATTFAMLLAVALWRGLAWHPVAAWMASINLVAAWLFWTDKRRARLGEWRIPESALLLASFLGGWPAGFVTSQILRHKTLKGSFRMKFWGVVALQLGLLAGATYWVSNYGRPSPDAVRSAFQAGSSDRSAPATSPWPVQRY